MLGWRFISRENADGADNLINPINLCEAIIFSVRGWLGVQPRRGCGWCGEVRLSPRSRHRFACRQREVTQTVTARAVNISDNQMARDCCEEAPKVLDYA